jgi:hypothetical protein
LRWKLQMGRVLSRFLSHLRDGEFLTRERVRLWAGALLIGFTAALVFLAVTAHGLNDYQGRPLGTDFSDVYTAGTFALDGNPQAAFDPARHYEQEKATFGVDTPFYGWHYPPFFLVVAGALASLPYLPALILWQVASLALYLAAIALLLRNGPAPKTAQGSTWLLCALAFPAVFVNLTHGQNGFLTAALLAGALALLDKRPIVAGILFGLLAYKPQFGILIPFVLSANARWKSFGAAAATVVVLVIVATMAFGADIWNAFLASAQFSRTVVLEQGNTGFEKIQSAFAAVRLLGGSVDAAYVVQICVTVGVAASLELLWRSQASATSKGAGLCLGVLLATPYCLDYDMMVLAPAIALLAANGKARGFRPYEAAGLAALWLVPIVTRSVAGLTSIPLGFLVMGASFVFVLRHSLKTAQPILATA